MAGKTQNDGQHFGSTAVQRPEDLAKYIDHTLLKPEATATDIEKLCREACEHRFKAVCVNPNFVAFTRKVIGEHSVVTASVVGFPLGVNSSAVKALETSRAIEDGAREIDMVIRLDLVKSAQWLEVEKDIRFVVDAARGNPVKVILETGLLTRAEIINACRASEQSGAAFVKTATGFLGRGASVEDVEIMRATCSEKIEIKASGGVKTFEQARALIAAGATRIGTSSGVALVTGANAGQGY